MTNEEALEFKGWCQCIDAIVASLKDYPNAGGHIEIMKEVDRLRREAVEEYIEVCD
jgi:hypothetical protein